MSELSSVPPRVALVVSTRGTDSVTVTVCSCSPGWTSQVDANFLADSDVNILALELLEAFGLGANCKAAGSQIGSVIFSGVVRGQSSRNASCCVHDGYRGAGYDAAALVRDRSHNAAEIALRKRGHTKQKHAQRTANNLNMFINQLPDGIFFVFKELISEPLV